MSYSNKVDPEFQAKLQAASIEILDDEVLYHAVPAGKITEDLKVKHSYFSRLEMSVDRAVLSPLTESLVRFRRSPTIQDACVCSATAMQCRAKPLSQIVAPYPITEENQQEGEELDDAHALVYGDKRSEPVRKMLSAIFVLIPGTLVQNGPSTADAGSIGIDANSSEKPGRPPGVSGQAPGLS